MPPGAATIVGSSRGAGLTRCRPRRIGAESDGFRIVKEALGDSGNVDHVVMTPAGVWAVETKAHWLKSRRFPAALAQAANNARRVRRHLKTPLPVRAALVIAERVDGPFERDHDWKGEPVKVSDATTFWRALREERRQGRAVERFADTERTERMVWDLGSSRHFEP